MEPGNLADLLMKVQTKPGAMPTLPASIVGSIQVRTRHLGHKKKLFAIGTNTARNQHFVVDGNKTTVENYFKKSQSIFRVLLLTVANDD